MLCYSLEEWGKVSASILKEHYTTGWPVSTDTIEKILLDYYTATVLWSLIPERWAVIKFADKRYKILFLLKHR